MLVVFIFEKSSSSNFTKVLNLCRKIGLFKKECEFFLLEMNTNDIFTQWDTFNSIFHLIKKWSSFELKIDNDSFFDYKSKSDFFYSIQEIKTCYKNYKRNTYKNEYCIRDFSCIWLKSISFSGYSYKKWYSYGKWISDSIWKVNKDEIRNILTEESKVKHLCFCPIFELEKSLNVINSLPDEINISIDKNWKIVYKNGFKNGIYQTFPYSIEFQEYIEPIVEVKENEVKNENSFFDVIKQIDKYLLFGREISNKGKLELSDDEINKIIDEWVKNNRKIK